LRATGKISLLLLTVLPSWNKVITYLLTYLLTYYGCHRQFLFLIGRFLKNLLLWNCMAKWTETW
jgi:hypothetical protein